MRVRSSGSVKVVYLDRPKVLSSVQRAVKRLVRRHPEISRVLLFGSMARGDAVPGNDVDLLIVLAESQQPFLERISNYQPSGIPVGVDVFPYTEDELGHMLEDGNPFVTQALEEGKLRYEKKGEHAQK